MERIYLDANGSSPSLKCAQDKIRELLGRFANPSSAHSEGRALRTIIDDARDDVANALLVKSKEIIFSSGASEANRLFVDALTLLAKKRNRALKLAMSIFEHPSLLKPVLAASDEGFFELEIFDKERPVKDWAELDVFVCCQAHNETGIVPKLNDYYQELNERCLVMSDISQSFARLGPIDPRADVLTFSGQKMGAFAGSGGLVLRGNAKELLPPWSGGGQERGFRPGTESLLLIASLGAAAAEIENERRLYAKLAPLRDAFEESVLASCKAQALIFGENRLANTSAICFLDCDPETLRIACDLQGLSVGFGAACSGLAPEPSFALTRLGLKPHEAKSTVRFSFSSSTSEAEVLEASERVKKIVAMARS
jgi:cysteine desulfurase